jgi:hypothetical protein
MQVVDLHGDYRAAQNTGIASYRQESMSINQYLKSSAHLLWTRLCAKPMNSTKPLILKEIKSMSKKVAASTQDA